MQKTNLITGGPITTERLIDCQQSRYERMQAADAEKLTLALILQELSGGPCPHCQAPWQKIAVDNAMGTFTYYDPDCDCYQRCKRCGMSMHGVLLPNRYTPDAICPRCGRAAQDRWKLLCAVCGLKSRMSDRYERWVCEDCTRGGRRKKRDSYEV